MSIKKVMPTRARSHAASHNHAVVAGPSAGRNSAEVGRYLQGNTTIAFANITVANVARAGRGTACKASPHSTPVIQVS